MTDRTNKLERMSRCCRVLSRKKKRGRSWQSLPSTVRQISIIPNRIVYSHISSVNFTINFLLLLSKGLAVLSSSSISLVASFIDSALDFLSTLIILGTSIAMGRQSDRHKYPAGKKRFEPLGVLIFAVAMIASFAQVRWSQIPVYACLIPFRS